MTPEPLPLAPLAVPSIAINSGSAPPPMAANTAQEKAPLVAPSLILIGRDERSRPHASSFTADDAEAASRAAELMGLRTLMVTEALRSLADDLPRGRLFASGKAFVPFCSAKAFADMLAAAGLPDTPTPVRAAGKAAGAPPPAGASSGGKGSPDAPGGAPKAPSDWSAIGIGSTVLACQGPMEGWWEAVVLYTKANDSFVLRWRDFPDDGEFTRARRDLALMPPGSREGLG
ncbi:hypothetical protein [Methylobacterium sp. R2-1]|uniref:hypothetical protein n=1 Tax=Methylobacterium sp. R2-1 TaxID=2587064 RepID=UPI00184F525F|nr:hypothetical protein [Methylobacterium sp. R2-1]MBB2963517.1 hypothetical protein [Methylobacterium sp. R2-1]